MSCRGGEQEEEKGLERLRWGGIYRNSGGPESRLTIVAGVDGGPSICCVRKDGKSPPHSDSPFFYLDTTEAGTEA